MEKKHIVRVVKGALQNPEMLERFSPKTIETFDDDPNWDSVVEVTATLEGIKELQKNMTKHYDDPVPWYLDGYETDDHTKVFCGFGADDGEGGRLFFFDRNDKEAFQKCFDYGVSKGIPPEQMDFLENY